MAGKREKTLRSILGAQVRRHRDDLGITQAVLAERCGLSLDMIGRIERGTIACSLETVAKLSEVLSVPAAILFGGSPLSESPKSLRERSLQQIFQFLISVDTKDLPWIERVLKAVVRR